MTSPTGNCNSSQPKAPPLVAVPGDGKIYVLAAGGNRFEVPAKSGTSDAFAGATELTVSPYLCEVVDGKLQARIIVDSPAFGRRYFPIVNGELWDVVDGKRLLDCNAPRFFDDSRTSPMVATGSLKLLNADGSQVVLPLVAGTVVKEIAGFEIAWTSNVVVEARAAGDTAFVVTLKNAESASVIKDQPVIVMHGGSLKMEVNALFEAGKPLVQTKPGLLAPILKRDDPTTLCLVYQFETVSKKIESTFYKARISESS